MNDITTRFLETYRYLEKYNIVANRADFAKKIQISTSMMTEIFQARSNVGVKAIQNTVQQFKQINVEWLITGEGKINNDFKIANLKYDPNEEYTIKTRGIPLIPLEAFAGVGFNTGLSFLFDNIEDRYVVPLFEEKNVDFLVKVRGNSMQTTYSSGDVVACKILEELLFVQWNRVHVLNTGTQGVLIKRLKKSKVKDHITCKSDNKEFDDFDVPMSDVQNIALVVGAITIE